MSGGVDSSVVAVLLKRLGYQVVGVTLQLARSSCGLGACCTGPDLDDVRKMCEEEGFPHHSVAAFEDFKDRVINYTAASYEIGLTPSPCVWCNSKVRFDYLLNAMKKFDCDLFVTGHYAHVASTDQGFVLKAGVDPNKDQSYFLSMLPQAILEFVRFPLGNMHKKTVRRIARAYGLKAAAKKDSQDLCFVKDNYWETLNNLNPNISKPGTIKHTSGTVMGHHAGIAQFTIGQRKGLGQINRPKTTNASPLFVVDIDAQSNVVTLGERSHTAASVLHLERVNLLVDYRPGMFVQAKIRANSKLFWARLWDGKIEFTMPILDAARGQICVMYQGRQVIGAGMIVNFTRIKQLLI